MQYIRAEDEAELKEDIDLAPTIAQTATHSTYESDPRFKSSLAAVDGQQTPATSTTSVNLSNADPEQQSGTEGNGSTKAKRGFWNRFLDRWEPGVKVLPDGVQGVFEPLHSLTPGHGAMVSFVLFSRIY